ncbi:hypothetical protein BH09BAC5_BH09BAC5_00350 [soil metagenome]
MRLLFSLGILLSSFALKAQVHFNNAYDINGGVNFTSSVIEYDNGYYFVSRSRLDSIPSINITKLDYSGNVIFLKRYFSSQCLYNHGLSHCLDITADNNIIFCGQSMDSLNNVDCFLMKFDSNGDTIWTKTFGGAGFDTGNAIFAQPDSTYIVIVNTNSYGNGSYDFWRVQLNETGNIIGSDFYGTSAPEQPFSGTTTSDNGMVLAGTMNTTPYIVKVNASGNQQWDKSYPSAEDYCFISQLPSGGYIVASRKTVPPDGLQASLIKTDSVGNIIWQKYYGTTDDESSLSKPIILNDGSIILGGYLNPLDGSAGKAFILKTDSSGNQKWFRTYYNTLIIDNYLYDIKSTSDGGFIFAGSTFVNTKDSWIVKLDSLGCEVAFCDGVGFQETTKEKTTLTVFPNPSQNAEVTVSWPLQINAELISVYDATGKLIFTYQPADQQTYFLLHENFVSGIYLIQLKYEGGILAEKLIVE